MDEVRGGAIGGGSREAVVGSGCALWCWLCGVRRVRLRSGDGVKKGAGRKRGASGQRDQVVLKISSISFLVPFFARFLTSRTADSGVRCVEAKQPQTTLMEPDKVFFVVISCLQVLHFFILSFVIFFSSQFIFNSLSLSITKHHAL